MLAHIDSTILHSPRNLKLEDSLLGWCLNDFHLSSQGAVQNLCTPNTLLEPKTVAESSKNEKEN